MFNSHMCFLFLKNYLLIFFLHFFIERFFYIKDLQEPLYTWKLGSDIIVTVTGVFTYKKYNVSIFTLYGFWILCLS